MHAYFGMNHMAFKVYVCALRLGSLCACGFGEMDKNWQETSEMNMYAPYPYRVQ